MADVDRGKDSHGVHATNALNYGHLGRASYQGDAREWSFLRRCVGLGTSHSAFPFVLLKRETVYENSINNSALPSTAHDLSSSFVGTNRTHPNSAPLGLASANTDEEEPLSSAIITSLGQYDPLFSDRLAFGSASWLLDNDVRSGNATVPILALASGANGESLTLTQIGKDRITVTDESDKESMFKIPIITSSNQTSWTGNGEAVLQICFAATAGYQSTWMAARLVSSTTIFHPLFHRRPVSASKQSSSSSSQNPHSLLDANPVLTIPASRTGGHSHADVSFHPLDCHVLALIDQHGNWSTWRIEGKRSVTTRALFRIQMLRTGKLYTWENLKRPLEANPHHDGWHRICWVADDSGYFDRLFLSNRRDAVIHAPLAGEKYFVSLGLGQITEAQWILDAKKSALHLGWIFVLTSTSVLCISTIDNEWRDMPKADSHTVFCSWQHFRGRRDITLSMTILETAYCTVILLSSRINSTVNAYRVDTSLEHSHIQLSWVEPSFLDMSDVCARSNMQNAAESLLTLLMRPVQIQRPPKASEEPLDLSLHKLFILHADRSVGEVLLQGVRELSGVEDHNNPNTILLPPESCVRVISSKYAELNELDDFIVHEREDLRRAYPGLHEGKDEQRYRKRARAVRPADSDIDFQEIYELMNQELANEPSRKRVHLDDHLQATRSKIERSTSIKPGMILLSDLSSPLLHVADVETSSITIASLAQSNSNDGQASSTLYRLPESAGSKSTLELYQSLVSNWLSQLPPEVPDRIRVDKERLARSVAAELALATIATGPSIHELQAQAVQDKIYSGSAPLAAATSGSSLNSAFADVTVRSQSVLPLPSVAEENPACARLRTYTTVSRNTVTTATPTRVLDILAHLPSDAEADPSTYEWRATEATITAERGYSAEAADLRVRRRAEKLAQAKRRRIQLQTKVAEELVRQRAPPAIGSSQMVLPTREVQSSQVMAPERNGSGDYGPMTQPERGTFGRRLGGTGSGRKEKGKQRKAGF